MVVYSGLIVVMGSMCVTDEELVYVVLVVGSPADDVSVGNGMEVNISLIREANSTEGSSLKIRDMSGVVSLYEEDITNTITNKLPFQAKLPVNIKEAKRLFFLSQEHRNRIVCDEAGNIMKGKVAFRGLAKITKVIADNHSITSQNIGVLMYFYRTE